MVLGISSRTSSKLSLMDLSCGMPLVIEFSRDELQDALRLLETFVKVAKSYNVHIVWVPGHNDIPGN